MSKEKDKKGRLSGLFGLDPTLGLGDKVLDHMEEAQEEERERLQKSDYYALCLSCGKKQIKENLLKNGCFICGWKGTKEDIELAQAERRSSSSSFSSREEDGEGDGNLSYKTNCPQCGASVITEEFLKNGCWRCGYKE